MRAEAADDPSPWRRQVLLGRDRWNADALRDLVREYVVEHLVDDDAVLVIDETGLLRRGKASCGIARQYTGSAGKITNCQIGMFATYVSRHDGAFADGTLYLPKSRTDDSARLRPTSVPDDVDFATKPQLAARMIARAEAAKVPLRWVTADTVYGVGDIERDFRWAGKGHVLASMQPIFSIVVKVTANCWYRCQPCRGPAAIRLEASVSGGRYERASPA